MSETALSTPKLSEVARHVVIPEGIVTTAWPRIVQKAAELGIEFDEWQNGIGRIALGKRADGMYAATVGGIVLSIPRQVGKTFLVGMIVIVLCLLNPGLTVLWTAHHGRTTDKTFGTLLALTRRRKFAPHMLAPRMANGQQELRFRNGSRIMFGAREQGFGRGFDKVDVEVFDEAQILTSRALDDMVPATNQSQQAAGALLFYMGTPPKPTDPSDEFTARRAAALAGKSDDMVYVEFSADTDADPEDRLQWAKANPSYPVRTSMTAMRRMRANLTDDASFLREGLGVWGLLNSDMPISLAAWRSCYNPLSVITKPTVLAADISPDRSMAAIAVAGPNPAGVPQVEITGADGELDWRPSTDWIVPRLVGIAKRHRIRSVVLDSIQGRGLQPALEAEGLTVLMVGPSDMAGACAQLHDAVASGQLVQVGQLDAVLGVAKRRDVGDSGWAFAKRSGDITPLVAVTLALWGMSRVKVNRQVYSFS